MKATTMNIQEKRKKEPAMRVTVWVFLVVVFLFFTSCAHTTKRSSPPRTGVFIAEEIEDSQLARFAPEFRIDDITLDYDRPGQPTAVMDGEKLNIVVNPDRPVMYYMKRHFFTPSSSYTNLIYRIHFNRIPWSLIPFHLTAGKNPGLMVVITLNNKEEPVLVTTVHTCGCYVAVVPVSRLHPDALPENWNPEKLNVYGETLPGMLEYDTQKKKTHLVVTLRSGTHRVRGLQYSNPSTRSESGIELRNMTVAHMDKLKMLPVSDGFVSFYHEYGPMAGYVKGSLKPLESIFISPFALTLFIGSDKVYNDSEQTGNRFFTSLKPWNRKKSDMWDFATFLTFWGWKLP